MNKFRWFEGLWQDFRYGGRVLRANPGFLAVATLSLALGIGANTAIFELLDAVRLRMLPISHPEQLADLRIAKNPHCCSGNFQGAHPDFTYAQWGRSATTAGVFEHFCLEQYRFQPRRQRRKANRARLVGQRPVF